MNRKELLALADRVEAASGPDRRLDAAICRVVKLPLCEPPDCYPAVFERILRRIEAGGDDGEVGRYTASLDAALTLVPEGWDWAAGTGGRDHGGHAFMEPSDWSGPGIELDAASPALALVAASLRALAGGEG